MDKGGRRKIVEEKQWRAEKRKRKWRRIQR